tara:strand:- start:5983 stop:6528 length:546 start_codon:yes stop_codon:yes gene_type:complete
MSIYSKTITLPAPSTTNQSTFNTRRQFPNNNGQTQLRNGMPGKDGVANNSSGFAIGRQFYSNYRKPDSYELLRQKFNALNIDKTGQQTSNTIVKTSQKEVGKPIPQNSSDLYIQRRRMTAVGKGSTQPKTKPNEIIQLKGGEDKNYTSSRLNYCKAGGSIAPSKNRVGPSQPSIFCRHSRR